MDGLKSSKRSRSKSALFNPYINGISSYDMAYLSSKTDNKNKNNLLKKTSKKNYFAA